MLNTRETAALLGLDAKDLLQTEEQNEAFKNIYARAQVIILLSIDYKESPLLAESKTPKGLYQNFKMI